MKKVKISAISTGMFKVLTRAELKGVVGGDESLGCSSCTYKTADGNSHTVTCNKNENDVCVCPDRLGCGTN